MTPILAERPILIASHPRSGTHLALDMVRRNFASTRSWRWWGLPLDHLYLNLERLGSADRRFGPKLAWRILTRPRRALLKTHFTADFAEGWHPREAVPPPEPFRRIAAEARVLYVVRHPLDALASFQQFLTPIDPAVARQSFAEFLAAPHWAGRTDRLGWWASHVAGWTAPPHVRLLRYEDLTGAPDEAVRRLGLWLGETPTGQGPLLPPKVESLWRTRMDRLTSRAPASTGIVADGQVRRPDWRRDLTPRDLEWVADRLGPVLAALGYDTAPRPERAALAPRPERVA